MGGGVCVCVRVGVSKLGWCMHMHVWVGCVGVSLYVGMCVYVVMCACVCVSKNNSLQDYIYLAAYLSEQTVPFSLQSAHTCSHTCTHARTHAHTHTAL